MTRMSGSARLSVPVWPPFAMSGSAALSSEPRMRVDRTLSTLTPSPSAAASDGERSAMVRTVPRSSAGTPGRTPTLSSTSDASSSSVRNQRVRPMVPTLVARRWAARLRSAAPRRNRSSAWPRAMKKGLARNGSTSAKASSHTPGTRLRSLAAALPKDWRSVRHRCASAVSVGVADWPRLVTAARRMRVALALAAPRAGAPNVRSMTRAVPPARPTLAAVVAAILYRLNK
mmetsp:Transcript_25063/g.64731  ORF Transcript_25063/g.64731 Transcript_25063/m.64731 type:complete len:230 (-) Transcript_25063:29-718(-)